MFQRPVFALVATLLISSTVCAHEFKIADLRIGHPYARPTVPGQPSGVAYLSIENNGKNADTLIAVSSPAAKTTQIHSMSMDNNVMKMREVNLVEIAATSKISMKPGDGYHIMLIGLQQALKIGDKFPLTLTFKKSGRVKVTVHVEDKNAKNNAAEKPVDHSKH